MDAGEVTRTPAAQGWTTRSAYTLALLTIIYAFNTVDRNLFGLMVPLVQEELRLSDTMIGLLSGFAFAAFYATAALPIASLADRWNRRNIIAIGLAFWSLMTVCHGLVRNGWQLALTRFLLGAGEASSVAPSNSMIADLFGPAQRPFALGFLSTATSLGILFAFPILGYISGEYGWRAAFAAAGVPGMALALLFFLTVREPKRVLTGPGAETEPVPLSTALRRLAGTPAFMLAVGTGIMVSFNLAVMSTWVPAFLSRGHGLSQAEIGGFIGMLRGPGGIIGAIGGGFLASWLGKHDPRWRYRVPAIAMLLVAPAQLALIFGNDYVWQAGLALETMLVAAQMGPLFAILLATADMRTRSVAIAAFLFVTHMIGQTGGPLISGWISDFLAPSFGAHSIRYGMLTAVVAAICASLLCVMAGRRIEQSEPDTPGA